ncbi:Xrn1 [Ecytonucleospora hepatopenaei]|uniref:Xrn1 n=1 Tax=Ecytonucleospora hepatopenaei TaxID=646526 RepID=A0A1W0E8K8_9MICR|nr:Xrn1 [Ecytonucleospora hepatopenaei]
MGVPSLYKWITMRFPGIVTHLKKEFDYNVDNLYLDFNAIIHPCTDKSKTNLEQLDDELYRNLERYVDALVAYCKPKKMIYISVDGVAPKAKMNQQRTRRFKGAKDNFDNNVFYLSEKEELLGNSLQIFDQNSISPGTEFMERLNEYIQELIKYKLSTDVLWKNKTVIYSNYQVPGEGEQKIMEYLRIHKKHAKESHVIYSPDADLIFLGLTLPDYNLRIMREEFNFGEEPIPINEKNFMECKFTLVNENKLKDFIIQKLTDEIGKEVDGRRILSDFVFLCFAVGNDFLPCVPCFEIRTNAIEKIFVYLSTTYKVCNDYITCANKEVNFHVLKQFFTECEKNEYTNLKEKRGNLKRLRTRYEGEFDEEAEFDVSTEDGKMKYYVEKMGISSEEELNKACASYIQGMVWIYKYYFFECPSWDYYYPYYYAPFMVDLRATNIKSMVFELSKPLRPFEQLLSVLPAMSMHLLPVSFRSFYYQNKNIVVKEKYKDKITGKSYFEEFNKIYKEKEDIHLRVGDVFEFPDLRFEIDGFQKIMDWQYLIILPFMNNEKVSAYSKQHENDLSYEEVNRNMIGTNMIFTNKERLVKEFGLFYKQPFSILQEREYCGKVFTPKKVDYINVSKQFKRFVFTNKTISFSFDQRYRKVLSKSVNK